MSGESVRWPINYVNEIIEAVKLCVKYGIVDRSEAARGIAFNSLFRCIRAEDILSGRFPMSLSILFLDASKYFRITIKEVQKLSILFLDASDRGASTTRTPGDPLSILFLDASG